MSILRCGVLLQFKNCMRGKSNDEKYPTKITKERDETLLIV